MIIHPINLSGSSIFFRANIVMRWLIPDSTLTVLMSSGVILNDYLLSIYLISQLSAHNWFLVFS